MKKLGLFLIALFVPALLTAQIPNSNHVVVVLEENQSYPAVIGSASMPYLNSLASQNALATQYYANVHPSIGNYFMLTAGELVTSNDSLNTTVNVDNIVRHLLTAGKTWKSYAESLPSVGYIGGDQYPYIRHHNPLSYFTDVANSSVQRLNLVPFSHFSTDLANNQLPNYSFVVPNQNHNAHDCPTAPTGCTNDVKLATADAWLKNNIGPLLANPGFQRDGILIIVFDEGFNTDTAHGGGHVVALAVGPGVKKGFKSTAFYQHQNVLRTTLDALGVHSYPGVAGSSADMSDLFGAAPPPPPPRAARNSYRRDRVFASRRKHGGFSGAFCCCSKVDTSDYRNANLRGQHCQVHRERQFAGYVYRTCHRNALGCRASMGFHWRCFQDAVNHPRAVGKTSLKTKRSRSPFKARGLFFSFRFLNLVFMLALTPAAPIACSPVSPIGIKRL